MVQRLPWLVFTLPVGVITDRYDRRTLMVLSNIARTVLTLGVAFAVLGRQDVLPAPDVVSDSSIPIPTDTILYLVILLATLCMGIFEVLYDNSAQTLMPSIVHADDLERANGRMWSTELIANTFVGPPLGALLIAIVVQPAVLRRRRDLRRVGGAHRADPAYPTRPERRRRGAQAVASGALGGLPVAVGPRTAPTRWRSSSASSTRSA